MGWIIGIIVVAALTAALLVFVVPAVFSRLEAKRRSEDRYDRRGEGQDDSPQLVAALRKLTVVRRQMQLAILGVGAVLILFLGLATSFVIVPEGRVGHLTRVYLGKPLPEGRVIAFDGEMGPQAKVLMPGFHFSPFLNVLNEVTIEDIVVVPEGQYAILKANDGAKLAAGVTYADAWTPQSFDQMWSDAEYFLKNGGQKGTQTSVLLPGSYPMNRKLWDVAIEGRVTDIPAGFVGVITSAVHSGVDFGNLRREKPDSTAPVVTETMDGQLANPLVPVGAIGVWAEALLPGRYYINERPYKVTLVPTTVQTWEYKGGYQSSEIDLEVNSDGEILQKRSSETIAMPSGAADAAVSVTMEGWTVYQELRALVQITADRAPFVVASVGAGSGTEDSVLSRIEDRVLTPSIRSIVRNVLTSSLIQPDGASAPRRTQVLDTIENRPLLEQLVEDGVRAECLKAGVELKEVRFGETDIPPELLVARRREQLAQQLAKAFQQEQLAQTQRIAAEQARATAAQQSRLVEAEIDVRRAEERAKASRFEGEGERDRLTAIAQGEQARVDVLGADSVVQLRRFELLMTNIFDMLKTPEGSQVISSAIQNAHKFVPNFVVQSGGNEGNSLVTPSAILGHMLSGNATEQSPEGPKAP